MASATDRSLDNFFSRYCEWEKQRTGGLPRVGFEADWPSPAIQGEPDDNGLVTWRPVLQQPACAFGDLENALELSLHADLHCFYTRYFAAPAEASFDGGNLSALFVWNEEDFRVLMSNIIGHALEKRRLRQPFTVFFANIDDSRFLSIDNTSGQVVLEILGAHKPLVVAANLSEFLDRLAAPVSA